MNIVRDIVDAVMNNDTVAVQLLIDQNQIHMHDCLALRTAVYCNNAPITQMVVEHSDIFAWNSNAIHLSIENSSTDIFDILFPYILAKEDTTQNFEFLLQAVAADQFHMVEKLTPIADVPHQSVTGLTARLNNNPHPRIIAALMVSMDPSQRITVAENFALTGDFQRLKPIVEFLTLSEVQTVYNKICSFSSFDWSLSEKGRICFDAIDQQRQKRVLEHTVGNPGSVFKKKL